MKIAQLPGRSASLYLLVALLLMGLGKAALAETLSLESPDGDLTISVDVGKKVHWSVSHKDQPVITASELGLVLEKVGNIAQKVQVADTSRREVDKELSPVVPVKSSRVREHYRELTVQFDNDFGLQFRAYNDGVAYRFVGQRPGAIVVDDEIMALNFPEGATTLFPEEESLISHYERLYVPETIADIGEKRFGSLPAYMAVEDINVVFTEADLFDYPNLFLYGTGKSGFRAGFPGVVTEATPMEGSEDRNQNITFADHIAETSGDRSFPWRLAVISPKDADLIESQLVYLLSRETQLEDTSWIKPGKIAWDWYNANNLYGVDFEAGINTETYKYYIDFASEYGLEYVILDEGWTKTTTTMLESSPDMDVKELIEYGRAKGVRIILWTLWGPLNRDYENILATWAEWGAAGIKVDFMQRGDQAMVNYYETIAREAAKNELLVDFHGGYKPNGLRRAYPNVMTHEGVKGNENNKWSSDITPQHNVTLPFTRMVAGPMDYTPGAVRNAQPENHHVSHYRPMSIGTRAHEVAMYAVFESPLQMLCDSPSNYYREPETTDFIARFPTVWDETRALSAEVGEHVLVARRSGDTWYLGAMTNDQPRTLTVNFSFLANGDYELDSFRDGINTTHFAEDYKREQSDIASGDSITIKLAAGGGWAAIVSPK